MMMVSAMPLLATLAGPAAAAEATLPPVAVSGVKSSPVQKSYRRMVHGLEVFEALRPRYAPQAAELRFRLLPRKKGMALDALDLGIESLNVDTPIAVAADRTFTLPSDPRALQEDAVVTASRRQLSMTWRTEIRSPGLPPGTRRLGDLRLECRVGIEADLVSNEDPLGAIGALFAEGSESYCGKALSRYLFFAERPLFGVTLVDGARREALPAVRLWAGASEDPGLAHDLPYCDCEVLVDRSYFLPLGDASWSDETRVEFEYMDGAP